MKKLYVKISDRKSSEPCAICGNRTEQDIGPGLFLENSGVMVFSEANSGLVCRGCGEKHAPELQSLVELHRNHQRILRELRLSRH